MEERAAWLQCRHSTASRKHSLRQHHALQGHKYRWRTCPACRRRSSCAAGSRAILHTSACLTLPQIHIAGYPHLTVDTGAQIPLEDVPSVQKEVVVRCRQQGKPVIVASHLLQSMMEFPTPTRAEVSCEAEY